MNVLNLAFWVWLCAGEVTYFPLAGRHRLSYRAHICDAGPGQSRDNSNISVLFSYPPLLPRSHLVPIEYPKDLVHSLTASWASFGFWQFPINVFHSRNVLPSGVVTDLLSLPFSSLHQFHDGGDHSWSMVETTLERDSPQYGFFHQLMWRHDPIRAILQQSPEPFKHFSTNSISRER